MVSWQAPRSENDKLRREIRVQHQAITLVSSRDGKGRPSFSIGRPAGFLSAWKAEESEAFGKD
jgi:hypothetical protein